MFVHQVAPPIVNLYVLPMQPGTVQPVPVTAVIIKVLMVLVTRAAIKLDGTI